MYNDEQNLYHYTYRKDGTEPGQRYDAKQPTVDEQLNSYRQQQEVSVTWGAVPADQATDNNSQSQQSQNNNSNSNNGSYNGGNGYYSNPWDIFNYYFGNQG